MTVARVAASTARATSLPPAFGRHLRRFAQFQVAVNVFQHDDRVVNQPGKGQGQPAQNHRVDGAVAQIQREKGGQRRQAEWKERPPAVARMLPRKIKIISPVSTKPMAPSCTRFSMAALTNTDWSKTTSVTSCLGTSSRLETTLFDAVDDRDGVRLAPLLQDREINRRLAVDAHFA